MKTLKILGAVIGAAIVVLALLLIVGVPSGFLTSTIRERVERDTGYKLTIAGTTKLSLWPSLNVTLNDLTLDDPKDQDGTSRITVGSIQADMTLSSAWSGHPQISDLIITRPVLHRPLRRERERNRDSNATLFKSNDASVSVDHVSVKDGTIVLSNLRDRVERRLEAINAVATVDGDRRLKLDGTARAGDNPLKFGIKAELPAPPLDRQNIPLELTLDAPSLLGTPLSSKAEVRLNGSVVMINGVSGTIGDGAFNGWASVDLASKPLVKLDLDFQRLDIAAAKSDPSSGTQPWSDAPMDLNGLNYVDAQVRVSAATVDIGAAHFAPAAIEATLAAGVLKSSVSNLGVYGGQASGEVIVDASSNDPTYAMHCDLVGVNALPLLQSLAGFDKIEGKMQAKIATRSMGASHRAIMSNVSGSAFINFQDGALRGVNVARMIRSLTASTLTGWQESQDQATDLAQLSASFKIDRGQAVTTDLSLVGPLVRVTGAGTIDLGTKLMAFRVEPKLVMTTEGQGSTVTNPIGFGIPVMIDGSWSQPRIYPEIQGIFDNPDAAYAKLREMGKGLFAPNGGGLGGLLGGLGNLGGGGQSSGNGSDSDSSSPLGGNLGETLGNLIQQGLGGGSTGGKRNSRGLQGNQQPASPTPDPGQSQLPPPPPATGDSQPMNDVLKQLFNR